MEKFVLKYILIALACIVSYNAGTAQTAPADRTISVNISGSRLDEALQTIASAGRFSFSYNSDCIPFDNIVSIGARNQKVRSVLRSILPARIQIKEKGNYVILTCKIPKNTRSRHNAGSTYIISGYIIDRYSGQRIPMASVYDKTNYALALTNDYGYYTIQVPGNTGAVRLIVSKKYYLDTVIVVKPADSIKDLCIQLTPQMERVPTIQPSEVYSGKSIEDIGIVNALVPDKQLNQTRNNPQKLKKGFNLSLVPGLSTNRLWSGNTTNVFALNILIGYSSGITGVEIGGLFNIDKSDVKGVQISGLGNIVGGRTEGVQAGGLFNFCLGKVYGLQIASFSNILLDTLNGISISGFAGFSNSAIHGIQVSGFSNVVTKNLDGIQLAGNTNITLGRVNKLQVGGFGNYAAQVKGIQIASFGNLCRDTLRGIQLSAGFNFARHVKGLQVSPVNISDTLSGFAFGLFTFSARGYHKLDISSGETFFGKAVFRTGMPALHNIFALGVRFPGSWRIAPGYGLGSEIKTGKKTFLDVSLIAYNVYDANFSPWKNLLAEIQTSFGGRVGSKTGLFGCISLFGNIQKQIPGKEGYDGGVAPYWFYAYDAGEWHCRIWLGASLGLRLF